MAALVPHASLPVNVLQFVIRGVRDMCALRPRDEVTARCAHRGVSLIVLQFCRLSRAS